MSKIKVRISETKFHSFYKTLNVVYWPYCIHEIWDAVNYLSKLSTILAPFPLTTHFSWKFLMFTNNSRIMKVIAYFEKMCSLSFPFRTLFHNLSPINFGHQINILVLIFINLIRMNIIVYAYRSQTQLLLELMEKSPEIGSYSDWSTQCSLSWECWFYVYALCQN